MSDPNQAVPDHEAEQAAAGPEPGEGADASEGGAGAPRVLASAWTRLGAYLVDLVVLYAAAYLLQAVGRESLLQLNPWLPWIAHLVLLGYFGLGQGPLGKGRTAGKAVFGIRVVDAQGQTLGHGPAFVRGLFQQAPFLMLVSPELYMIAFTPSLWRTLWLVTGMAVVVALPLTLVLVLGLFMHPRRRSWHDLLADSFVIHEGREAELGEMAAQPMGTIEERKAVFFPKASLVVFLLGVAVLGIQKIQSASAYLRTRPFETIRTLNAEHDLGPFRVIRVYYPEAERYAGFLRSVRNRRAQARRLEEEVPTTATLERKERARGGNFGKTITALCVLRSGSADEQRLERPGDGFEGMRAELWARWQALHAVDGRLEQAPAADDCVIWLFEPLPLVIKNGTRAYGHYQGPANPDEGGLTFMRSRPSTGTLARSEADRPGPTTSRPPGDDASQPTPRSPGTR